MIVLYKAVPNETIQKEANDCKPKLEDWFAKNPKRRICNAQGWYDRMFKVRRGHVSEDVDAAAKAAMK